MTMYFTVLDVSILNTVFEIKQQVNFTLLTDKYFTKNKKLYFIYYLNDLVIQVGIDKVTSQTYRNLLSKLPQGPEILSGAYKAIEKKIKQVLYNFIFISLYINKYIF